MKARQIIGFILTPLLVLVVLLFADLSPGHPEVTYTFCVALLMAVWWITEVLPLAVTSLIPVVLFPIMGIMDAKVVAATYFNDVIFLFMGGFMVALAMERWHLHKRIALHILAFFGAGQGRILLGFMAASFFLSMWISNTATVMMMLPIALSVIKKMEVDAEKKSFDKFSAGLLLALAYGASTGGMATLVGTPPNLSFMRIYQMNFPDNHDVTFTSWLILALPIALIITFFIWLILYLMFCPKKHSTNITDRQVFKHELKALRKTSFEEKIVFILFVLLAVLWIFRADINIGASVIPGWSRIFSKGAYVSDGTVAMFVALLMFLIPSKTKANTTILNWKTASALPWHILLLFGGGFALAAGFMESGLSLWFGHLLSSVATWNPFFMILAICIVMTFLTELTSNTATTEMILPVLAGIAITTDINPLMLMIPATMSASMAFMLPVATPPNAIIFGTGKIKSQQMARTGLIINFVAAIIITVFIYIFT